MSTFYHYVHDVVYGDDGEPDIIAFESPEQAEQFRKDIGRATNYIYRLGKQIWIDTPSSFLDNQMDYIIGDVEDEVIQEKRIQMIEVFIEKYRPALERLANR